MEDTSSDEIYVCSRTPAADLRVNEQFYEQNLGWCFVPTTIEKGIFYVGCCVYYIMRWQEGKKQKRVLCHIYNQSERPFWSIHQKNQSCRSYAAYCSSNHGTHLRWHQSHSRVVTQNGVDHCFVVHPCSYCMCTVWWWWESRHVVDSRNTVSVCK